MTGPDPRIERLMRRRLRATCRYRLEERRPGVYAWCSPTAVSAVWRRKRDALAAARYLRKVTGHPVRVLVLSVVQTFP